MAPKPVEGKRKQPRAFLDIVATGTLNLGDISTTMSKQADGAVPNKFALLMNYVEEGAPEVSHNPKEVKINNLLSNRYYYKIILLFELKFSQNPLLSDIS